MASVKLELHSVKTKIIYYREFRKKGHFKKVKVKF
jgi:hypothetical protein